MNVILWNEGSLAPFKDREKTISYHTNKRMFNKKSVVFDESLTVQGILPMSRIKMRKFLKKHNNKGNDLILITKSYGCVETYREMVKDYKKYFGAFRSIKWFCVDGWSIVEYGANKKSFLRHIKWKNLKVFNYFQKNDKIKGAFFKGGKNLLINTDHIGIIKHPSFLRDFTKNV